MNSTNTNTIANTTKISILRDLCDDIDVKKAEQQNTNKTANHSFTALSPIKAKV